MSTQFGVYPEGHQVVEDAAGRRIIIRTPYYEVAHSLDLGGAVSEIILPHARPDNLLLSPCRCEVGLSGAPKPFAPAGSPRVETAQEDDGVRLSFEGPLQDADGKDSGIVLRTTYVHKWGHVRIRQELLVPPDGRDVQWLLMHSWTLRPEMTHFGVRAAAPAEVSSQPSAFGVCQWGRFRPGRAFDSAWESRHVPRYVCFAAPGRYGLEWFIGSELAQWDYQVVGRPGHGSLCIASQPSPPGVVMRVCALDLPRGSLRLAGRYAFDSYIGIPIITGRAHAPFLHTAFNRRWPSNQTIEQWARGGIRTAHFHHDGDSFKDGLFWRDGTYPPFGPDDMKEYDRVIATCHRHGIRVATYFSNKELHPSVQAWKDHGGEWARLPDDRSEQVHNYYSGDEFGAQMCLRSGWLEFFKNYVDTVLSHHDLDGTYYDWNLALYCHNVRHAGMVEPPAPGIGALASSPAGHWDMDELLELMQWTRRRVGPDGLMIVHNTMVPMAATENFADRVVAMEWGYAPLSLAAPDLGDLPLEWSFMGARSRGVIGYGCLAPGAPESVHRQMTVRCLLSGVAPWPAQRLDLDMFKPLRRLDLTQHVFHDWRSGVAQVSDPAAAAAALYSRPDHAVLVVGNLTARRRAVRCMLDLRRAGLSRMASFRVSSGRRTTTLNAARLRKPGIPVALPAHGVTVVIIEPARTRR
jgi:hypothetical protein